MIYGIVAIWFLCGILAYGQWIGGTKAVFEPVLGVGRDRVFVGAVAFLLGPVGLFAVSSANWTVLEKPWFTPSFQIRTSRPTDPRFR